MSKIILKACLASAALSGCSPDMRTRSKDAGTLNDFAGSKDFLYGIGISTDEPGVTRNVFFKIDADSGIAAYKAPFGFGSGSWMPATFTLSRSQAYAVDSKDVLNTFDLKDGKLISQDQLQPAVSEIQALESDAKGQLYVAGFDHAAGRNYFCKLDMKTTSCVFRTELDFGDGGWSSSTFTVAGDRLYAVAGNSTLFEVSANDGELLSKRPISPQEIQSMVAGPRGKLIIAGSGGNANYVCKYDLGKNQCAFQESFIFSSGGWSSETLTASKARIYAVASDDKLYAFDAKTGQSIDTKPIETAEVQAMETASKFCIWDDLCI